MRTLEVEVGLPAYVVVRPFKNQAMCKCGWEGKRRLLSASAVVDAWQHCYEIKHD